MNRRYIHRPNKAALVFTLVVIIVGLVGGLTLIESFDDLFLHDAPSPAMVEAFPELAADTAHISDSWARDMANMKLVIIVVFGVAFVLNLWMLLSGKGPATETIEVPYVSGLPFNSHTAPARTPATGATGAADRLRELDSLRQQGLINDQEYETKRGKILDGV